MLATNGEKAIHAFRRDKPHLTILDLRLPDINGLDDLRRIRALVPDAPIIILTGAATEEMEIEVQKLGVSDFLLKGFSLHALKDSLDRALKEEE